jgi:hypothetical protein
MELFMKEFGNSFLWGSLGSSYMYVIGLFGALCIAISIERFYVIMASNVNADKFMAEIRNW